MNIAVAELSLVALIGSPGSGKSSFAKKYFKPTEIVSLKHCREMVADEDCSNAATGDAFELLYSIVAKRLKRGLLTVIDASSLLKPERKRIVELARNYYVAPVSFVFDCDFLSSHALHLEGFRQVTICNEKNKLSELVITRFPLAGNRRDLTGPFDIIGDLHGCFDELYNMVQKLGYSIDRRDGKYCVSHPYGRKLVFLGDLGDRGPKIYEVFSFVMDVVETSAALCVPGNHDIKLLNYLLGRQVTVTHGLDKTIECIDAAGAAYKERLKNFIEGLSDHYVLDGSMLIVAHAGLKEDMHGREAGAVKEFALYGETTGERDEFGLPVRHNWAQDYKGEAVVVYGHVAVPQAVWINNSIDIDTGCVYGNKLTALRYPERELVSVPAAKVYYQPIRPLERNMPEMNEIDIIKDKYAVTGDDLPTVVIHKENITAALEVMSRFAVHPKWLVYLPPTMSPPESSALDDFLEHPLEAFEYYRSVGVRQLICEEKHMGTRVCLVIGRDEAAIEQRFQLEGEGVGKCYTRTGRNYFQDINIEELFLQELSDALTESGFWEEFDTDWAVFDCEMIPWSYKYEKLIKTQYAAIASAADIMLAKAEGYISNGLAAGLDLSALNNNISQKKADTHAFRRTYRHYCSEVNGLKGFKIAPFCLLAVNDRSFFNKDHKWHMDVIAKHCSAELFATTPYIEVDLANKASVAESVAWWLNITNAGSEGMVVKPLEHIAQSGSLMHQPALKCRGKEHLRLIYGAGYLLPENLERLKARSFKKKRNLAIKEFVLGIRGLDRFVRHETLERVHEVIFGVLALQSEEIDPQI